MSSCILDSLIPTAPSDKRCPLERILFRPEGKQWTPTPQPTTPLLQVLGPDTGHAVHAIAPAAIATV
jgi:hypothetical protein